MISEIFIRKVQVSSTSKTCDMSDDPSLALIEHSYFIAVSAPSKYSVFVIAI
jgi:hypothetical protein